jgi:hypothetical protein
MPVSEAFPGFPSPDYRIPLLPKRRNRRIWISILHKRMEINVRPGYGRIDLNKHASFLDD